MICKRCKEEKTESEMYSNIYGICSICNKCVRKRTSENVKMKLKRRRDFVNKFNKIYGVDK